MDLIPIAWNVEPYHQSFVFCYLHQHRSWSSVPETYPSFSSYSGSAVSSYSEMKSTKTVSRKRWARSVSFELDGDLYAVDLEEGYRPLGSRNSSWARDRRRGAGNEEDNEEFSGMGVTAKPTASNKLTPPASLKVTYRCFCAHLSAFACDKREK